MIFSSTSFKQQIKEVQESAEVEEHRFSKEHRHPSLLRVQTDREAALPAEVLDPC